MWTFFNLKTRFFLSYGVYTSIIINFFLCLCLSVSLSANYFLGSPLIFLGVPLFLCVLVDTTVSANSSDYCT